MPLVRQLVKERQFSKQGDWRFIIKGSKNGSIPLFKPAIFLKFMAAYLSLTQAETRARPR